MIKCARQARLIISSAVLGSLSLLSCSPDVLERSESKSSKKNQLNANFRAASKKAVDVAVKITDLPVTLVKTGISSGSPCPADGPLPGANESRLWVPDGPARAYVDKFGDTRLIVPHLRTFPFVGSSLDDVKLRCNEMIDDSAQDANHKNFNDSNWLWAPYRLDDGRAIVVYHNEFHPPSHDIPCKGASCWFAALTLGIAEDGINFSKVDNHVIAKPPQKFNGMDGVPKGYSDHTNIAKNPADGMYYLIAMRKDPELRSCVLRTNNLLDAGSWRAWDGRGYNANTSLGADCVGFGPDVGAIAPGSLTYSDFLGKFVYLVFGDIRGRGHGFYMFLAEDTQLTSWSDPIFVMETPLPWGENPTVQGRAVGFYPSFLDPNGGPNFDRMGERPYLYFVYGAQERRLMRVPVQFLKSHGEIRNRAEGFYRVEGGGFYSNGFNQFCSIGSMDQLRKMGWTHDFKNLTPFADHGNLEDAGQCGAPRPVFGGAPIEGCYRIGGTGFYSNGQGASCPFLGNQMQSICGTSDFEKLELRGDHGSNAIHGQCSGPSPGEPASPPPGTPAQPPVIQPPTPPVVQPPTPPVTQPPAPPAAPPPAPRIGMGCYKIGPSGFWSNGQGQSCVVAGPFLQQQCQTDWNGLRTEPSHSGNIVAGGCHLPRSCYRIGGTGFWSNGQGASCPFLAEQMPRLCNNLTVANFSSLPDLVNNHYGNAVHGQCQ